MGWRSSTGLLGHHIQRLVSMISRGVQPVNQHHYGDGVTTSRLSTAAWKRGVFTPKSSISAQDICKRVAIFSKRYEQLRYA